MARAVLFDLGGTLVEYYARSDWPKVRDEGIAGVVHSLAREGYPAESSATVADRAQREDHESPDFRVRPLAGRLARIFSLSVEDPVLGALCRTFLQPVFARGRRFEDSLGTLDELRTRSIAIAVVSNLPWGSPSLPWREELGRWALSERVDTVVFCADVGWRKPDRRIFERALTSLGRAPDECLFVGDDPRWDAVGAARAGIPVAILERTGGRGGPERRITALTDVLDLV